MTDTYPFAWIVLLIGAVVLVAVLANRLTGCLQGSRRPP